MDRSWFRSTRRLAVAALAAVVAVAIIVVATTMVIGGSDDEAPQPVAVSFAEVRQRTDPGLYRSPRFTTDGATAIALDPASDGDLVVSAYEDTYPEADLHAVIPSGRGVIDGAAIGALPGSRGRQWVAVTRPHFEGRDEHPARVRPGVWLSRRTDDRVDAVTTPRFPVVLSVDDPPLIFAAMATVGERTNALVIVGDNAFRCDVDDCAWERVELPGTVEGLASAGTGFVLVTEGDTRHVWYADTASLKWASLGDGPASARATIVTSGPVESAFDAGDGEVTILWWRLPDDETTGTTEPPNEADDRPDDVDVDAEEPTDTGSVQVVVDGELRPATEPAAIPDGFFEPRTIARSGDRWIVGGQQSPPFEGTSGVMHTGAIVYLSDDEWVMADADVLARQLYQTVDTHVVTDDGELVMISDGIFDVRMMWRVEPVD